MTSVPHSGAKSVTPGGSVAGGAGHTPHPWTIIPARPHEEIDGAFEAFAGIEGADGSPVCVFGDASGSATMFENEADYSLIAAAPELLAVCAAIAPYLGATEANDWNGLEDDDAIAMPVKMRVGDLRALKAAISKATAGETRNAEPIHRRDGDEG